MPTRCFWPPLIWGRIAVLLRGQPDEVEQRQHGRLDVGAACTGQLERQRDVVEHRA